MFTNDGPVLSERQCPHCPGLCCLRAQAHQARHVAVFSWARRWHTNVNVARESAGSDASRHPAETRTCAPQRARSRKFDLHAVRWANWTPPAFVPTRTDELDEITSGAVIGVELRRLFPLSRDATYDGLSAVERRRRLCAALRAQERAYLVAVLHGDDPILARFWQSDRRRFLAHLKSLGFAAATGPTFSIVTDTNQRLPFENHLSLRQHHQVIQEITDAGLVPIPNLYAAGSTSEAELASWLRRETSARLVSRDFSRTKSSGRDFHRELGQLVRILEPVGRPMHVLLIGVSVGKAAMTAAALSVVGASCSIVSGQPILRALLAGERLIISGTSGRFVKTPARGKQWLAAENVRVAKHIFTHACTGVAVLPTSRAPGKRRSGAAVHATPDRKTRPA